MNDGISPSDDLEHTVNANASGQTFADENARQQRAALIEEQMAYLSLLGTNSSKAVMQEVMEGVGDYNASLRNGMSFATNPMAKALYDVKLALGMTTPEKELERQREKLEDKARGYDRTIEHIRGKREELQQDYFKHQDRRDAAIKLRTDIKAEVEDVGLRLEEMKGRYAAQQQGGNGQEGGKTAADLRIEYHTAEMYRERLSDYLTTVNQEIVRANQIVDAKRRVIDFLGTMKDQTAHVKLAKVDGVLIHTGDQAAIAGTIVDIARLNQQTDADIEAYAKNARVVQDATGKLEGLAYKVMDQVKPRNGYNGSHPADTRRETSIANMRKANEQMDDRVEQLIEGLRTEPLG